MSDTHAIPEEPHGPDLTELRAEIDELASQSTEELVSPAPKIVEENEPEAFFRNPRHERTRAFLGEILAHH